MTTPKHTPGPWTVADSKWAKCKYIASGKRVIATVHGNASEDYQANAELFAASTELAECLRECLEALHASDYTVVDGAYDDDWFAQRKQRAAALLERLGM